MGVRPPGNDGENPESIEFGIAALDARLDQLDVTFPIDAESLERAHGDMRIPVDPAGNKIVLSNAISACDRTEFESEQDLLNALHPVFERKRERMSNSIIGQLRSLLPF
ncbi:MAG: hypothetical protein V5A25_09905 [Halovenus sp.]